MSDAQRRRIDALERQTAGMLAQRQLDRARIEQLEKRCAKLEAAVLHLATDLLQSRAERPEVTHQTVGVTFHE